MLLFRAKWARVAAQTITDPPGEQKSQFQTKEAIQFVGAYRGPGALGKRELTFAAFPCTKNPRGTTCVEGSIRDGPAPNRRAGMANPANRPEIHLVRDILRAARYPSKGAQHISPQLKLSSIH